MTNSTYFHVRCADGTHHSGLFTDRAKAEVVAQSVDGKVVTCLDAPDDLDAQGLAAHAAIVKYLTENGLTQTGGCLTFYSPKEWRARGESYGRDSHLIVVYDGSQVARAFSLDKCYETARPGVDCYRHYEGLHKKLEEIGLFSEECTKWYSAVYTIG